jgi:hypothetical protein
VHKKNALAAFVVVAVAIPVAAQAAHERRTSLEAERELASFTSAIEPIAVAAGTARRVTLNGAPLFFKKSTEQGTLDEVMARIAKQCGSGDTATAFGVDDDPGEGPSRPIRLERVFSQESEGGVRASLCIFANEGSGSEEVHRVRYTLANKRDDGSIAVTTVVNASSTPLQELFPADGDSPGSDPEGVARPAESRRSMTAIVGKGEHIVRVYESSMPLDAQIASYDRQMHALGYDTTGTLADARMFRKDGHSWVASFRATTGGSTVALMPFGTH